MNRRIRNQSSSSTTNYLRYLRPGALAQLRDSKIKTRSHIRSFDSQISQHRAISSSPASSPSSTTAVAVQPQGVAGGFGLTDTEMPNFSQRFYAPRCPQRKKLMAIRSMFDCPEPVIETFGNDFLVAH